MQNETRRRAKIGVLVPFTNVNLEPDLEFLRPHNTTVHFARLGGYDAEKIPGSEQMSGLGAAPLDDTLDLICGVRPDVILYGCTSATLTHGSQFDAELANEIKRRSGAVSLTAAGSLVNGLQTLGVSQVGFASPYLGEINQQAMTFLEQAGIATVNCADIGRALDNYGQGELTPEEVYELALRADHPDAQAIVLSCTDMRSVEVIEEIEKKLDKPVVTSNQAMVFCLMGALNIPQNANSPGRLFSCL